MEGTKLRFPGQDQPDHVLTVGMHGIVRGEGGRLQVAGHADAPVRMCVDRRGVWLSVDGDERGVHVNGRQIRRIAMLRVGDAVYVDGSEIRLLGAESPEIPARAFPPGSRQTCDPRIVLRGVGGRHHGRSFTLERPRLVGSSAGADIRIDAPAFADRHARLERIDDRVLLRDLGSAEGSLVNGETVRDAILQAGDQVVFDGQHRFVVEAPQRVMPSDPDPAPSATSAAPAQDARKARQPRDAWRLPWLLLAAVLLAALLAVLLLFGPA